MKPLLSDSQMAAVQQHALSSMKVEVVIKRKVPTDDDVGDDAGTTVPTLVSQPPSVLRGGTLFGYLRQIGGDTQGGVDVGRIQTTSTFELGVPIGVDVQTKDIAVILGRDYYVQDVIDDDTWPAMTNVILRRGT